jgi:short chain dehydrogenase
MGMALRHLAGLVGKPFAVVSEVMNTPNSAGRYRPFYFRNLVDAVQGRTLQDAVARKTVLITGGSSGIGAATARRIGAAGGEVVLVARTPDKLEAVASEIRAAGSIGVIGSVGTWTSRAPSQRHLIVRRMWS